MILRENPTISFNFIKRYEGAPYFRKNMTEPESMKDTIYSNSKISKFNKSEDRKVYFEEKKISFENQNIFKMKIINNFLYNQEKEKFKAQNLDYRRLYVIIDGTIILNQNRLPGKYFDIIKRKVNLISIS